VALFNRESRVFIEDATFLKLREVSLSLELPKSFVRKFWDASRYIRVSLTGRNLLIITPYIGTDPEETIQSISLAQGLNAALWAYPPSRSFWASIDVGF
jgi:hypothetical protein